jgi:hypothetical protein
MSLTYFRAVDTSSGASLPALVERGGLEVLAEGEGVRMGSSPLMSSVATEATFKGTSSWSAPAVVGGSILYLDKDLCLPHVQIFLESQKRPATMVREERKVLGRPTGRCSAP